ncbi:hypothetical protein NA57DRAFT_78335 [Rhizodiscina lignyota]|uniref:Uncharacterized protein n=1 Tax=Rhizodiscina lignyota TaxID=1504668 RepID=A0A9P4ICZ8_9PEZI|nr:hypothetical protein NA57DRAFT_78335 [Rhizodiscina lignyota]
MAKHDSPWLKRVLIPFWVLRLLFMLVLIGLYGFALAAVSALNDGDFDSHLNVDVDNGDFETAKRVAIGILAAFLFLLVVCFLLDIIAIVMFGRNSLRPKTFLIFNVLQTLLWTIMLVLAIIGAARVSGDGGFILTLIIFLLYLGLLIYASVVYHRDRKGRKYGYRQTKNPGQLESQSFINNQAPYNAPHVEPYRGVDNHSSGEYYNSAPQQPPTFYNPSTSPAPHQYQSYKGGDDTAQQYFGFRLSAFKTGTASTNIEDSCVYIYTHCTNCKLRHLDQTYFHDIVPMLSCLE